MALAWRKARAFRIRPAVPAKPTVRKRGMSLAEGRSKRKRTGMETRAKFVMAE